MRINYLIFSAVALIQCFHCDGFVGTTPSKPKVVYRSDYVSLDQFGTFVKAVTASRTWPEAKDYCEAEGGYLAIIRTNAEAQAIQKIINDAFPTQTDSRKTFWVGVHDLIAKREFQTIESQPIADVFSDWGPGEPNDAGGHEDCVSFKSNGKLNDDTCTELHWFLCKKDAATITPNEPCQNFDLGYRLVLNGRECIKFHATPMVWAEAQMTCIAEQARLAVIESQEEANLFVQEMTQYPMETAKPGFNSFLIHLGFHDKFEKGRYITVQGKPLEDTGYYEWDVGQPDNVNDNEHCGSMHRTGKLNDISCDEKAMFICKKIINRPSDEL